MTSAGLVTRMAVTLGRRSGVERRVASDGAVDALSAAGPREVSRGERCRLAGGASRQLRQARPGFRPEGGIAAARDSPRKRDGRPRAPPVADP